MLRLMHCNKNSTRLFEIVKLNMQDIQEDMAMTVLERAL